MAILIFLGKLVWKFGPCTGKKTCYGPQIDESQGENRLGHIQMVNIHVYG